MRTRGLLCVVLAAPVWALPQTPPGVPPMMPPVRDLHSSDSEWEAVVGYSRAIRINSLVHISGTTATDEDGVFVGSLDPYTQALQALANVEAALQAVGASLADVVRTRIYVTDIENDWEAIGRAHSEFFGHVRPATSMVEVSRLIDSRMIVEVEAEAIVRQARVELATGVRPRAKHW